LVNASKLFSQQLQYNPAIGGILNREEKSMKGGKKKYA